MFAAIIPQLTELSADKPRTVPFLSGLIDLVQGLGLRAVVEGLSSPELVALACIMGADAGQEYALSHPLPATELPAWVHAPGIDQSGATAG